MVDWIRLYNKYETKILVLLSTLAVSYILSKWIHNHYALFEYLSLILLFGLISEAWSNLHPDNILKEAMETIPKSQTGKQIILLWFISSAVFVSLQIWDAVKVHFGTLSVVQLLGMIVVLSRVWVDLSSNEEKPQNSDGNPDTYAAYLAGLLAIFLSWLMRNAYPADSLEHILFVIWLSLLIPYLVFYYFGTYRN